MRNRVHAQVLILMFVLFCPLAGRAQTTEFTYQGKLVDGALPANANYDFEFRLFAADSGGAAIATVTRLGVPVANGIFTVALDFGGQFDGSARWLEIAVKPASSPNPLTVLTPRQPLTSTPHSIRSLSAAKADVATNSLQLGGVNASQYVLVTDARMTDARSPLPNSSNYVQNTTAPQSSSNFNISSNGTAGGTLSANAVNATTQYNIGGNRILSLAGSAALENVVAGINAGSNVTTGAANTFFGNNAGNQTTNGNFNSFFGDNAGKQNTSSANSFFGANAGAQNTTGGVNSFFGVNTGIANTTGSNNSFFGSEAGNRNIGGERNSYFGSFTGRINTSGDDNSLFGYQAGPNNTASFNSFFGSGAGGANSNGNENSFFGAGAGNATATGDDNSFFGRNAGTLNTTGNSNAFFGFHAGDNNRTGSNNTVVGADADVASDNFTFATAIGAGARVFNSDTLVLGRPTDQVDVPGKLRVSTLDSGGLTALCRNSGSNISTCSSSLRYKTEVEFFAHGLDIVRRLRPISFTWKDGGLRDVGFGAEEVEKVDPLLVTYNSKGEIEGVKYGQLTTVLVNAIREQQIQIEQQQKQIQQQQLAFDELRKLVCRPNETAEICTRKQ